MTTEGDTVACPNDERTTRPHCDNPQCTWRYCAHCGHYGVPDDPRRWLKRPGWRS